MGGLRLSESKFCCGWILSGVHPKMSSTEHQLTSAACMMMKSVTTDPQDNLDQGPTGDLCPVASVHLTQSHFSAVDFFTSEDLGVEPARSCTKCKSCSECSYRNTNITREESVVVEKQESLMVLNEKDSWILILWTKRAGCPE